MRYRCKRCGCTMDNNEVNHYPGVGDVCEECVEELDLEAEHRRRFALTKEQQQEIRQMIPGVLLGV